MDAHYEYDAPTYVDFNDLPSRSTLDVYFFGKKDSTPTFTRCPVLIQSPYQPKDRPLLDLDEGYMSCDSTLDENVGWSLDGVPLHSPLRMLSPPRIAHSQKTDSKWGIVAPVGLDHDQEPVRKLDFVDMLLQDDQDESSMESVASATAAIQINTPLVDGHSIDVPVDNKHVSCPPIDSVDDHSDVQTIVDDHQPTDVQSTDAHQSTDIQPSFKHQSSVDAESNLLQHCNVAQDDLDARMKELEARIKEIRATLPAGTQIPVEVEPTTSSMYVGAVVRTKRALTRQAEELAGESKGNDPKQHSALADLMQKHKVLSDIAKTPQRKKQRESYAPISALKVYREGEDDVFRGRVVERLDFSGLGGKTPSRKMATGPVRVVAGKAEPQDFETPKGATVKRQPSMLLSGAQRRFVDEDDEDDEEPKSHRRRPRSARRHRRGHSRHTTPRSKTHRTPRSHSRHRHEPEEETDFTTEYRARTARSHSRHRTPRSHHRRQRHSHHADVHHHHHDEDASGRRSRHRTPRSARRMRANSLHENDSPKVTQLQRKRSLSHIDPPARTARRLDADMDRELAKMPSFMRPTANTVARVNERKERPQRDDWTIGAPRSVARSFSQLDRDAALREQSTASLSPPPVPGPPAAPLPDHKVGLSREWSLGQQQLPLVNVKVDTTADTKAITRTMSLSDRRRMLQEKLAERKKQKDQEKTRTKAGVARSTTFSVRQPLRALSNMRSSTMSKPLPAKPKQPRPLTAAAGRQRVKTTEERELEEIAKARAALRDHVAKQAHWHN